MVATTKFDFSAEIESAEAFVYREYDKHYAEGRIRVLTSIFNFLVIIRVSLFCLFICTVAANIYMLNFGLLWKIFGWSIGMVTFGIGMVKIDPKLMYQSK